MSAQRYMGEVDGLIPNDAGGWVTYLDYKESESRRKELAEALIECRWRLAAHQPTTGPHPNDVKALDMAEEALSKEPK